MALSGGKDRHGDFTGGGGAGKIRVLYLSLHDPRAPLTGSAVRAAGFLRVFARRFDTHLIHFEGSGQPPLPDRPPPRPIEGLRSSTAIPFRRTGYFLYSRGFYRAAVRAAAREKPDLIVCDYGTSALYGLLLRRRGGPPFLYSSHNLEYRGSLDKARSDPRRLLLAPFVYAVERAGVRWAMLTAAINEEEAAHYRRWAAPERVAVVPQGFDEEVFHPFYEPPRNRRKTILFCGNFGIPFNREALRIAAERIVGPVAERLPDVLFRFVGARPPEGAGGPNLEMTGFVDDYPALLRGADLVISPMRRGRGSPTKIIEALACGKPVVATAVGARSLEKDYAGLRIASVEEFPARILEALDRNRPVEAVDFDRLRSRYSWSVIVGELSDRLEGMVR
ncbi:MAG: glycosyltransferase family 4 protein [Candidatus Eisenbacteria bacterium]|nr:glycosyltransferase family 4 protein [Candidatus Eisenbacteria bacterium]